MSPLLAKGHVVGVLISPPEGGPAKPQKEIKLLTAEGILDDRNVGLRRVAEGDIENDWGVPPGESVFNTGQVLIASCQELGDRAHAVKDGPVSAESLGVNLILDGLPVLTMELRAGMYLCIKPPPSFPEPGPVILLITSLSYVVGAPCGVLAVVVRGGTIRPGHEVKVYGWARA